MNIYAKLLTNFLAVDTKVWEGNLQNFEGVLKFAFRSFDFYNLYYRIMLLSFLSFSYAIESTEQGHIWQARSCHGALKAVEREIYVGISQITPISLGMRRRGMWCHGTRRDDRDKYPHPRKYNSSLELENTKLLFPLFTFFWVVIFLHLAWIGTWMSSSATESTRGCQTIYSKAINQRQQQQRLRHTLASSCLMLSFVSRPVLWARLSDRR